MGVLVQIGTGSALLLICAAIHITLAARILAWLRHARPFARGFTPVRYFTVIAGIFAAFLASHTFHVYIWGFAIRAVGALPGYEAPIYFALVSYTTLGYGDIVLSPDYRILGALASFAGITMFGLTTAFLVSFFSRAISGGHLDS